jgi:hypothetical protein
MFAYGAHHESTNDQSYANSNYELHGRYKIDTQNLLADGNMEASGVTDWTAGGGATLTKDTDIFYDGLQSLEIEKDGAADDTAAQATLTATDNYTVTGFARGDGTAIPKIENNSVTLWTGVATASWQAFDVDFTAGANDLTLVANSGAATNKVYFDNVRVVKVLNNNKVWTPFAANRSCSAYLMKHMGCENLNKLSYESKDVWSTTV